MKDEELAELIERIRQELGETQRVLERVKESSEMFEQLKAELLAFVAFLEHGEA